MNTIVEFLSVQLVKLIDSFKMKNPRAYLFVVASINALLYFLWTLLGDPNFVDTVLTIPIINVEFELLGTLVILLNTVLTLAGAHTTGPLKEIEAKSNIDSRFTFEDYKSQLPQSNLVSSRLPTDKNPLKVTEEFYEWEPGKQYSANHVVLNHGSAYVCRKAHTSGYDNQPLVDSTRERVYWEPYIQ